MKRQLVLLALTGLMVLYLFSASAPRADAIGDWWDSNYTYRRPLTISGATIDGYPLRIFLNYIENFDSNCLANFQDVRFTSAPDTGRLNYWIENAEDGDHAIFWVLHPSAADGNLFMYYGNAAADNQENAENVFGFDAGFDTALTWTEVDPNAHLAIDTANSYASMTGMHDGEAAYIYHQLASSSATFTMEWVNYISASTNDGWFNQGIGDAAGQLSLAPSALTGPGALNDGVAVSQADGYGGHGGSVDTQEGGAAVKSTGGGADNLNILGTAYYRLTDDGTTAQIRGWQDDENRSGTPEMSFAIGSHGAAAIDFIYPISSCDYAASARTRSGWVDSVIWRPYMATEPTASLGAEAEESAVTIASPTVTEALIDRDQDSSLTTPTLSTVISVQITQDTAGENADTLLEANVSLFMMDNDSTLIFDNIQPISSAVVDENTKNFTFTSYNPSDAMADTALGGFLVSVSALDTNGVGDNWTYSIIFSVSDLYDNAPTQDNVAGHQHKLSGTAGRPDHGAVTLTNAWIADTTDGITVAAVSGATYDNTYAPTAGGTAHAFFETANLDGTSDNNLLTYFYPNLVPGIVNITIDNALIDNHRSDNAITTTLITAIWEDNDNFNDFVTSEFWLGLRDDADGLVENLSYTPSYENENRAIITYAYDAEDNNLTDVQLGNWDVFSEARDNIIAFGQWRDTLFVVDDYTVPIDIDPDNATLGFASGFSLTAAGTPTRDSGAVAGVDHGLFIDSAEGSIVLGAGAFSESYGIDSSAPGDVVTITVTIYDGILDGYAENTYTVNDNHYYAWAIHAEDNHSAPYNLNENRSYILTWHYENGEGSEEDVTGVTGEIVLQSPVRTVSLSDNGLYVRVMIPDNIGDNMSFYLLQDNANRDFTYQYVYTLEDYTGEYLPNEGGQLWVERLVDNVLVTLNSDYWDGDITCPTWLLYNVQHQFTVKNDAETERVAAYFWADLNLNRTIIIRPITPENFTFTWNDINFGAWRDGISVWVTYYDGLENTDNVTINIYDYSTDALIYTTSSTSDNFTIEWNGGDNDGSYIVEAIIEHGNSKIGTVTQARAVSPNLLEFIIPGAGLTDMVGAPISLAVLFSNLILSIAAVGFGARYDVQGMMAVSVLAAGLKLFGFLPDEYLAWEIIGLLLILSIIWALGKGGN